MSEVPASFKKGLKNFWFITSIAIGGIYVTKTIINRQRDAQFIPEHVEVHENDYIEVNTAKLQPGLPEPTGQFKRKSEYEGAGNSYSSRAKGDRFSGLLDMTWLFGSGDGK